jgi:hypothetical protein
MDATQTLADAMRQADMPSEAFMFLDAAEREDDQQMYLLAAKLVERLIARR